MTTVTLNAKNTFDETWKILRKIQSTLMVKETCGGLKKSKINLLVRFAGDKNNILV
jgi:hypothetical protein